MVVNLARFLQTLDADGAPDNGLRIPAAARAAAAGRDIDFSRSADRFAADPDWQALLAAAGAAGAFPEGAARETVPAAAAAAHLSRTLAALADNPEDPNGDGGGSGGSGADAGGG